MKTLLVQLNSQYIHSALAPWALAAGMAQYGCAPAETLELNINQPFEDTLAAVLAPRAELVGFCCYIWNMGQSARLARAVKALRPEAVIVLGGPEVSPRAEQAMAEYAFADCLIEGAGEQALALLALGADRREIPGLWYRTEKGLQHQPPQPLPLPWADPYTEAYFETLNGRISYIETTRGCPFSCAFCLSGRREPVTALPLPETFRRLDKLRARGGETIKFVDRTFNADSARAQAIWRYLMDAEGSKPQHCYHFEIGADLLTDADIALLAQARNGLFQVEAGLQSFHADTLAACDRKTDLTRLTHNLRVLLAAGNIHVHVDLIAGLPYEDYECFTRSFDSAYALHAHMLQLGFLKLIPGCKLRREQEKYGYRFAPDPPYEVLCNDFITYEQLRELAATAQAVDNCQNSGHFKETLAVALTETGWRPYELMSEVGRALTAAGRLSFLNTAALLYRTLGEHMNKEALRDALVLDVLRLDDHLPACLRREDEALARWRREAKALYPDAKRLKTAILYHRGQLLAVDEMGRRFYRPMAGEASAESNL